MNKLIIASLLINIAVLIPVCSGLITNANWIEQAYGISTQSRGIVLSIYVAILLTSILLMFYPDPKLVAALLLVQVIYKITTPITVGTMDNPVVISNLFIAAFHILTLISIWKSLKF